MMQLLSESEYAMNEKTDWELVDDNPQPKQQFKHEQFSRKAFLYSLLGRYPRLKIAALATGAIIACTLIAVFSLIALAGATVAGALMLSVAWCRARFFKSTRSFQVRTFGK
jgi:hypothetical protein